MFLCCVRFVFLLKIKLGLTHRNLPVLYCRMVYKGVKCKNVNIVSIKHGKILNTYSAKATKCIRNKNIMKCQPLKTNHGFVAETADTSAPVMIFSQKPNSTLGSVSMWGKKIPWWTPSSRTTAQCDLKVTCLFFYKKYIL